MAQGRKVDMKVVMLGRQAVGKSALVDRFINDRWTPGMASTIGGSFCAKEVQVDMAAESGASSSSNSRKPNIQTVMLGVWDTAGSERYESLTRHYFNQAESAFCCFDLTDIESWHKVHFWIGELHKVEPNCRIYIIGCKSDLIMPNQGTQPLTRARGATSLTQPQPKHRCVTESEVLHYCSTITPEPAQYFETSALTGAGIHQAFQQCCRDWIVKPKKDYHSTGSIDLDDDDERRRRRSQKGLLASCCNQ